MLSKQEFRDCVNTILAYWRWADKVYSVFNGGFNIWEVDELNNITSNYEKMLCKLMNDSSEITSDWISDQVMGTSTVRTINDKEYKLSTVDELYDFLGEWYE